MYALGKCLLNQSLAAFGSITLSPITSIEYISYFQRFKVTPAQVHIPDHFVGTFQFNSNHLIGANAPFKIFLCFIKGQRLVRFIFYNYFVG